jgi:hypothetical protein
MTPILESSVSVFTSRYDKHVREHVPLDEMLTRIQSGIYQDPIARLRQYLGVNQAAYKAKKDLLPSFTPCCAAPYPRWSRAPGGPAAQCGGPRAL